MPSPLQALLFLLLQSLTTPASAFPRRARLDVSGGSGGSATGRTTVEIKSPGIIAGIALGSIALVIILLAAFIWRRKVWQDRQDQEDWERAGRSMLDGAEPLAAVGRDG
ncbi:unnamed protein product [Tuber melanosporum]|uniref:(Perigord truffle) hypothetical protein n=1 Tax=Tuber melanosporum (strain Mel28) TaxID=656061 RepID=D5GHU0_TUBMM|nr:uncharacterized protein GSTUM_00008099001 [Tuber melanosporum]CAZ84083.1 unnamed protein product [Tuber melanosporum]